MALLIAVAATVALLTVALRLARWHAARTEPAVDERSPVQRHLDALRERRDALPALPDGHRPPTGLGPISPSERALAEETARGFRELQSWLLDAA